MRASKRIAALTATAALLLSPLAAPNAQAAPDVPPEAQAILDQNERIDYLGHPVTTQQPSPAVHGVEDGEHVAYRVFQGDPAMFAATDVATGETLFSCELPGAQQARSITITTEGDVYWNTYFDYTVWRYQPGSNECEDLGRLAGEGDSRVAQAFGMTAGPDNSVYAGVYPESRLVQIHADGTQEVLHDPVDPGEDYIHAVNYHEATDTVYTAVGGTTPKVYRIPDGGRGEPELIFTSDDAPGIDDRAKWIARQTLVHDRLIGSPGLQMLAMDLDGNVEYWNYEETRNFFGHTAIEGVEPNTVIFSGDATEGNMSSYNVETKEITDLGFAIGGYFSGGIIDDSSGTPMLYGSGADSVFVVNMETKEVVSNNQLEFENPTQIQKVFAGPDNTIWASGYPEGLTLVDKEGLDHGATAGTGQYESVTVVGDDMYFGYYGHAKFGKLSEMPDGDTAPVVDQIFNGQAENQDRPFGMDHSADRGEIYMGTVGGYGFNQGGLAVYDIATGEHEWYIEEIGVDENLISVAYNEHDGMVYLGSTLDGGLGGSPNPNDGGKLIVFDPAAREVVKAIDPAGEPREGITGLLVTDDGRVWGVAEEALFVYDPETGESEVKATVGNRYGSSTVWAWAYMHQSPKDGKIYGSARGPLFSYDIATDTHERILDRGASYTAMDEDGDIYFASSNNLYRYNVEEVAAPEATTSSVAPVTVAGRTANVWGNVDGPATITTQVNIPGRGWTTSQTREVEAGFYAIELTYGKHTAGDLEWRVVVTHEDGTVETGEPMTQTRLKAPTAATAGTTPTGRTANVWGWADGTATKVWSEVQLADGRWAKSQETTPREDGWYAIELTYGKHTPGVQRWRVAVEHDSGLTVRTAPVTFVRS